MTNSEPTPIIELKKLTYAFPGAEPILRDLDFSLHRGQRVGLIAPNGSGKTTMLHLMVGLIKADRGQILYHGNQCTEEKDFSDIRRSVGLLFQDADDQLFNPTVLEDVAFGPLNLGKSKDEAIEVSKRTLTFLGLEGFKDRVTFKLSGGEKRLVALATVLSMEPEILLLDEPTAGLDEATKERLIKILNRLDISIIVVSHEFDFVSEVTNAIYTIRDEKIQLDSETYLHRHLHSHTYGSQSHEHR